MHTPKIKIRGWRGISHSYAMVNQFQLLAMQKIAPDLICHEDVPYLVSSWSTQKNSAGLSEADTSALNSLDTCSDYDAVYNIYAPPQLLLEDGKKSMTFLVTETGLSANQFAREDIDSYKYSGGMIHTPSQWSHDRLVDAGFTSEMILVIPHAAHESYFYKYPNADIEDLRNNLNYKPDEILLLNVGSIYWNKGLDILIKAYATARKTNPKLRLILKDQVAIYGTSSRNYIAKYLAEVDSINEEILNSIQIVDANLSLQQLNDLYNIADAYVTPYRAEGFNLPACEAQKCMTPVIATRGGATDDFLNEDGNYFISGIEYKNQNLSAEHNDVTYIEPHQDSLISILEKLPRKTTHSINRSVAYSWRNAAVKIMGHLI